METLAPIESVRLGIRQSVVKTAAAPADDLVVARRRMRHLAPWDIKPLPMMHAVAGLSDEPLLPEQRERNKKSPFTCSPSRCGKQRPIARCAEFARARRRGGSRSKF